MEEATKQKLKKWFKWYLYFAAVVVVIVGVVFLYVFSVTNKPTKVAKNFLTTLSSNMIDEAYKLTSSEFKKTVSPDQFKEFLDKYPILTSPSDIAMKYRSRKNGMSQVGGIITSKEGNVAPFSVVLVNENGEWRGLNLNLTSFGGPKKENDD